jgi:4-carboxymuconolactone decarboxylase
MTRLKHLERSDLDPDQMAVLEAIQGGPRGRRQGGVGLVGPYGVWVRAPSIGMATQALGAAVRFESTLAEALKEVAICTVGAFYRSKFEFAAHRTLAIAAGVDEAALERLRVGEAPRFAGDEALAHEVTITLLTTHRLDDELYTRAMDRLGESGLIELVTVVGYYCLVSLTLNAFQIPLARTMADPFPDMRD